MAASLDTVPRDVLQHIAYLLATASATEPPRYLLPLLLTSSKIHRALNVHECPHLYANIFRATFDFDHILHSQLTDSTLAVELHRRYRILWRTRRKDTSSGPTLEEIYAAIRMVLENKGHNEKLLSAAGVSTFVMTYVRHCLGCAVAADISSSDHNATMTMLMWLLCLTLTHQDIVDTTEANRSELSQLLRFPTTTPKPTTISRHPFENDHPYETEKPIVYFSDPDHITLLEQASPIIILIFALNEAVPITIPSHIPETRAIAIASQRSGPTAEDFCSIAEGRTPLYAETQHVKPAYESVYNSKLRSSYISPNTKPGMLYVPGSLAGLWEGSFMISGEPKPIDPLSPPMLGNFKCLKPMQCAITEYLCFSPHLPLPSNYPVNGLESAVKSLRFGYEKHFPASNGGTRTQRDSSKALDVIFFGKTLHDHEQAWNGFKFAGRVSSDGCIVMYREPKSRADREGLGTWIFEGHLRYGLAFVGQWRTSIPTATCDLCGIFSLRMTDAAWHE